MYLVKWVTTATIIAFPVLAIVLHNAANACLLLLLLNSIIAVLIGIRPAGYEFSRFLKDYWPLHLAMASWFLAVLLNQLSRGEFSDAPFDRTLRLGIFAPVFWIILALAFRQIKHMQWSFIGGTLIAAIDAYVVTRGGTERPGNIGFIPIIAFSNMTLLLGAMALISIGWNERHEKLLILLKILAFCVALYVTILTQTRGSWIAIPAIVTLALGFFANFLPRYKSILAGASLLLIASTFTSSSIVHNRFSAFEGDIDQYRQGNRDTSLGARIQMWQGAWILFKEHPLFGVGRENFKKEMTGLASRKIVTPAASELVHSHNEVLFNMATYGIGGLFSILSIYFVPAYYFARDRSHQDRQVKTAAYLGLLLCISFFFYGLVDLMFFWNVTGSFYSMSVAVFMTCIIKRKEEIKRLQPE
ncbi:O-antigen ligase family protein [Noviherbaspirillum autotrophicum]|uniref:O-antigen ligase family protein n=1 Tax=Noviherbaspirillum autotrophicum TaxID=709839 RepID=UPI000693A1A9|nr:O-antigen ligase family protein [Noviherbaspirillum autotrophicum]